MASARQENGYLYGPDQLVYTHPEHYRRALSADDLYYEEVEYQRVYHSPH
jgi:hypothetical protein